MDECPEKLEEFAVTPREYAGDYKDGQMFYDRVVELTHFFEDGDRTPADYAKSLGFRRGSTPSEYGTATSIAERWLGKTYPYAVQGVIRLHCLGVFPGVDGYKFDPDNDDHPDLEEIGDFKSDNKYFELLSLISSLLYWSGHRNNQRKALGRTSKTSIITSRDVPEINFAMGMLREIDWVGNAPNNPENYTPSAPLDPEVSRLVGFLGAPLGSKKKPDMGLPSVVEAALETFKNTKSCCEKPTDENRRLAYRILRDFALTFFVTRCRYSSKKEYSANVVAGESPDLRDSRVRKFLDVLSAADFETFLPSRVFPRDRKDSHGGISSRSSVVKFSGMEEFHLDRMKDEFRGRVVGLING